MNPTWSGAGRRRRRFCADIIARDKTKPGYHCPQCNQPIDWALAYPNPHSASVDHIIELQDGGDMWDHDNAWSMHLVCNTSKGSRRRAQRQREHNQEAGQTIITAIGSV